MPVRIHSFIFIPHASTHLQLTHARTHSIQICSQLKGFSQIIRNQHQHDVFTSSISTFLFLYFFLCSFFFIRLQQIILITRVCLKFALAHSHWITFNFINVLPFSIQHVQFSAIHHWWIFLSIPLMSCGLLCWLIRLKLNRSEC